VGAPSRLEHVLDRAEIQELTDYPALDAVACAHPNRTGASRLRRALRVREARRDITRSELEIAFKELCRAHGLPEPRSKSQDRGQETLKIALARQEHPPRP
jgi:hypothetical protein